MKATSAAMVPSAGRPGAQEKLGLMPYKGLAEELQGYMLPRH
jgi:hypothetical protein